MELTRDLAPFLRAEQSASEWPGTTLIGGTAIVRHYEANPGALPIVLRVGALYSWLAPRYPEDLAFYTADNSVWLGSSAHEHFAYFGEAAPALEDLRRVTPALLLRRRDHGVR